MLVLGIVLLVLGWLLGIQVLWLIGLLLAGPGLAKWAHSPHPWTALHRHLAKYIHDPRLLDETTSRWHNEIMAPTGSDRYRVEHGGKMRGKRIGPG